MSSCPTARSVQLRTWSQEERNWVFFHHWRPSWFRPESDWATTGIKKKAQPVFSIRISQHLDIPQVFGSCWSQQDSNILQEVISYKVNRARERGEFFPLVDCINEKLKAMDRNVFVENLAMLNCLLCLIISLDEDKKFALLHVLKCLKFCLRKRF